MYLPNIKRVILNKTDVYEGEISNNNLHGKGIYTLK